MTAPSEQHPPPRQEQDYPGHTAAMDPRPRDEMHGYEGSGVLAGQRGDSGIGRAVAVAFAKEGADSPSPTCPSRKTRAPGTPPNW